MSFYIKSFRLSPQALEKHEAIPDKTKFTIETDVVCLQHQVNCGFNFVYFAGDIEIANSYKDCRGEVENHYVSDEVEVVSDRWGGGNISEVPVMVVVSQEDYDGIKDSETSTWVEE